MLLWVNDKSVALILEWEIESGEQLGRWDTGEVGQCAQESRIIPKVMRALGGLTCLQITQQKLLANGVKAED